MMRALRMSAVFGITLLSVGLVVTAAGAQPSGKAIVPVAPPVAPQLEAPLSLTASDGAGLELVSLTARAVIEDPLAFTELHLTFRNPEARVREGRFRITLPEGATVSRFAMLIGNTWQEGEVVELQAARRAYEDFLHRRQDPALLETEAGNEFSARVFPIPPRATKELIISYSQELTRSGQAYRLPLRGLPKMSKLAIRALLGKADVAAAKSSLGGRVARHEVIEVDKQGFLPDRDFEVAVGPARLGLRNDNLVVARIAPLGALVGNDKLPPMGSLLVLFDTSASRALGWGDQIGKLQALLGDLAKHGDPAVSVLAFDQFVEPVYAGKASGFGDAAVKKLRERRPLGASNLEAALAHVTDLAKKGQRFARVLLVTDGVATAGEIGSDKLRPAAKSLGSAGVQRLDALAVGGIRDQSMLSALVTAGLPADGVVVDATASLAEQTRRLLLPTRSGVKVEVPGAEWVWPDVINGVQPGDEILIYADLTAGKPFAVRVGGVAITSMTAASALIPVERPLLERATVKARISRALARRDALGKADADLAEALRKQVIELSTRYRVLCPYTALLVLETEADYARFGIERKALADILTVGPEGIAVQARKDFAFVAAAPTPEIVEDEPMSAIRQDAVRPIKEKKAEAVPRPAATKASRSLDDTLMAAPAPAGAPAAIRAPSVVPQSAPAEPRLAPSMAAAEAPLAANDMATERRARHGGVVRRIPPRLATRPMVVTDEPHISPYEGEFAEVMDLLAHKRTWPAMVKAWDWRQRDPGDVLALLALGETAEASGDTTLASRAYGSIIDLFPGRADLRRYAGQRLERVRDGRALALAVDTFRKAAEQRPDHPASHRLLGMALLKLGRPAEAFEALARGVEQRYPDGRFRGAERILGEDLALAATVWMRAEPAKRASIEQRLRDRYRLAPDDKPSLRFVLVWETDANDVDFHILDGRGNHAYYSSPSLPSGGALYADVTTGYGPECFTVPLPVGARTYPYRLQAHYYSRGPMGYGMGQLQIVEHDGKGELRFEERPFLVMRDQAYVELGTVSAPLK